MPPLSEHELRVLQQLEECLSAPDDNGAVRRRSQTSAYGGRHWRLLSVGAALAAIAIVIAGVNLHLTILGVLGFAVLVASCYVAMRGWRRQRRSSDR